MNYSNLCNSFMTSQYIVQGIGSVEIILQNIIFYYSTEVA
jgi:hypothetical protein